MTNEFPTSQTTKGHILIIEDHKETADLLEILLTQEDYRVSLVYDADRAVSWLKRAHQAAPGEDSPSWPDLILLDLMMPGTDPVEALGAFDAGLLPPILVVSANPTPYVREAADKLRAGGLLLKPFEISELVESVGRILAGERPPAGQPRSTGHAAGWRPSA